MDVSLQSENFSFPILIAPRLHQPFVIKKQADQNLIFIATGTGLAPFLSFFDNCIKRDVQLNHEKIVLFYGCRHPNEDAIHLPQLIEYANKGLLSKLCVAFSRTTQEELQQYCKDHEIEAAQNCSLTCGRVNDAIQANTQLVGQLLTTSLATIYVCGDWMKIKANVEQALKQCFGHKTCRDELVKLMESRGKVVEWNGQGGEEEYGKWIGETFLKFANENKLIVKDIW